MSYCFYDKSGHFFSLTFNAENFRDDAKHVLVFVSPRNNKQQMVLTRHKRRGWELPGGKVEPGETPAAAACRELFEETGVKSNDLRWIGQYVIDPGKCGELIVKNIYAGTVYEWLDLPPGFETLESRIFTFNLQPFARGYSDFIQDNLFPLIKQFLLNRTESKPGVAD
ncbi:NUDIX domain-containing protein [Aneurinibacillus sp. Ricciae_BoGa-3]|uniref:NUDIX domain-containing protein n=1 Tax=Aneurinibacillus sp. Ricciae_BoGa-3 TaxID=3022697 RepID=UPI00234286C6|nr:NUDIX domain-containing protein [Aneurinibacillus sp. Ricciae_BoGa-3]WCK53782.1 NUDIX domain-containing protein [Aneurinibacillus sp. Ricciae_BoGa-3]